MNRLLYALVTAFLLFAAIIAAFFLGGFSSPFRRAPREEAAGGGIPGGRSKVTPTPDAPDGKVAAKPAPKIPEGTPPPPEKGPSREKEDTTGNLPFPSGDSEIIFEVRDGESNPMADVTVTLRSGRRAREQTTARDGNAVFGGIPDGTYTYQVKAGGLPDLVSAREVHLSPEERKKIALRIGVYNLSIAGRVLDRTAGKAIAGITVRARELLSEVGEEKLLPLEQEEFKAVSDQDGTYEIKGLDAVDYVISTERTEGFPSVRKVYRAGTQTADLILDLSNELEIFGIVTAKDGPALDGVQVVPNGQAARGTRTNEAGEYSTSVELAEDQTVYILEASREGFRTTRASIRMDEVGKENSWRVDIVMEPLGAKAPVQGVLLSSDRSGIPGETVHLQSPALHEQHRSTTDASGRFSFGEVPVGKDYRLIVYPKSGFKDHVRSPVVVPEEGLDLEIVLESSPTGSLRGLMTDESGSPIPQFGLSVRSMQMLGKSIALKSDAEGRFKAEGVPEGELLLETHSLPRLSVRGIVMEAGQGVEVTLVLDWGQHAVSGTVQDESAAPVPGARVSLQWSHESGKILSSSYRNAVADEAGRFSFSELGPGEHRITVNAPGYLQVQTVVDVGKPGNEPTMTLQKQAPPKAEGRP